jgi:hypothetical protein
MKNITKIFINYLKVVKILWKKLRRGYSLIWGCKQRDCEVKIKVSKENYDSHKEGEIISLQNCPISKKDY